MTRHDIQMTWDYSEANPFSNQAASWGSFINSVWRSIDNLAQVNGTVPTVRLGSATELPAEWTSSFDAVITDPPYYDSITYADLSDYFYVWHKRIVGDDYPEAFVTEVTPKEPELVEEAVYHGGTKALAKKYYEDGMAQAFKEMSRVLKPDGLAVIMFAHKKSSAWETLVSALIRAGFQVTASWPLQTEGRRLQSYRAVALASSVYLVCRKRAKSGDGTGYLEDIRAELSQTIRRYLEKFWAAGIGGADFFMSAIGPGLSVYSRFARVERYDGTQVSVSDFLDLVRHEVAVFAIERIVGERGFTDRIDQATQFYLLWRWGYSDWDVPDGEAVLLSTAVGIDLNVLMNRFGLVAGIKGKLRLLTPPERSDTLERVVERVDAGGAVPLVDVLHKACLLWMNDQQDALSSLVASRGGEMWPIAQAVVELLPREHPERRALESMLGIRVDIESRAQKWAETQYKPKHQQMSLWDDK
jgi:adenine-specific DNA methylase